MCAECGGYTKYNSQPHCFKEKANGTRTRPAKDIIKRHLLTYCECHENKHSKAIVYSVLNLSSNCDLKTLQGRNAKRDVLSRQERFKATLGGSVCHTQPRLSRDRSSTRQNLSVLFLVNGPYV